MKSELGRWLRELDARIVSAVTRVLVRRREPERPPPTRMELDQQRAEGEGMPPRPQE